MPRLEAVTEADITAALAGPSIVGDSHDPNLPELARLAGQELMRRFREEPSSLPGTFVIKLYLDGMKAIAAGAVPEDEDGPGAVDVLKSLDALPPEHARELVAKEIVRLGALLAAYHDTQSALEAM